jgi:repressor LexA
MKGDVTRKLGEQNRKAVLAYLTEHINTKGYAPSVREIGAALGLTSSSTVSGHITRLEAEGHIKRVGVRAIALVAREGGKVASS